jgi:predicted nucleotidyltransferase
MPVQNLNNGSILENEATAMYDLKKSLSELLGDQLVKFVLFGSKARGDADSDSDLDVAIVIHNLTRDLKRKILDIVADIELKYLTPLSTIIFNEEEFNRLLSRERRIALDIVNEGIEI